ncbi:hypothetical protein E1A91_A11G192900v1 [Gossypium mustelinum]|uniref:Uncharacterized protein n=1 Tax=Gossypium mustelinum TaxID=34275 RepID=A0A5D2X830_GOSMU|nr:hypothetical protein E1A91_A11G192900v1 [Gossypium mustelinum]
MGTIIFSFDLTASLDGEVLGECKAKRSKRFALTYLEVKIPL